MFSKRPRSDDWRTPSRWTKSADFLIILMAVALPWSTTFFGVFAFAWFLVLASIIDAPQFRALLKSPQCALPVAMFGLAIVGMLWSDATWATRLHSAGTLVKLFALPFVIYQFERSECGIKVFVAFFFSCTVLLFLSWFNWFDPRTVLFSVREAGVPIKNSITQGQEFVLCTFGSAALAIVMWRSNRLFASICFALLVPAFLLNMAFVVSSRTALLSILILMLVLTFRYISWRCSIVLYGMTIVAVTVMWFASPYLRHRVSSIQQQYALFVHQDHLSSVGLRLEYWSRSLKFVREAPLVGHGTGSIKPLFERDAIGKSTTEEQIVANPHNQALYFAVQWGMVGFVLLSAMWIVHFLMFTELRWISWIGTLVVAQNIFSSLFNSHLSDFVEGWIYVLGVGVAAGMTRRAKERSRRPAAAR